MNSDAIKELLDLVQAHDLAEFELEDGGFKLRVKRGGPAHRHARDAGRGGGGGPTRGRRRRPGRRRSPRRSKMATQLAIVKSPIVGTFYRSAEPGAASFVNVGDTVKKGQVLCIIEAMKLMNEIDSEYDGEITNVYVENGQPVQYGERIFAIRLRS